MHYIPVAPPPPRPQTTAIFRNFKKSTAMCKVHNVGLRYIKTISSYPLFCSSRKRETPCIYDCTQKYKVQSPSPKKNIMYVTLCRS